MPRQPKTPKAGQETQVSEGAPSPYDPNTETDQRHQIAAHYWELLRRNKQFQAIARRWVRDERFRLRHSASADYHNLVIHFPRCALDWMLSVSQRVVLARHQFAQGRLFVDSRFNFGPVEVMLKRHPLWIRHQDMPQSFDVRPFDPPPFRLSLEQSWCETPEPFRNQFVTAVDSDAVFEVLTSPLKEVGDFLHWAAARIARRDRPDKLPEIADKLFTLGQHLKVIAEFHHVFAVPNARCPPGRFKEYLDAIRKHCIGEDQIESAYCAHASWLGTATQWRYFLIAEQKGYRPGKATHMYELARIYSEDLRQRRYAGTVRQDAKPDGYKGTRVNSRLLKDRRATVRGFIRAIQEWTANAYPPARWLAYTRPPSPKSSGNISPPP